MDSAEEVIFSIFDFDRIKMDCPAGKNCRFPIQRYVPSPWYSQAVAERGRGTGLVNLPLRLFPEDALGSSSRIAGKPPAASFGFAQDRL
jgi:hypothetical protein